MIPLIKEECCPTWAKAHEPGTDNEAYGSLVGYMRDGFEPYVGSYSELGKVNFCPWCGKTKC